MSGVRAVNRLLVIAGGTGGHIVPAIAFGEWVKREKPYVRVDYVSGSRPVELAIYRASDIEPFVLDVSGSPFGVSGLRSIKRWVELLRGFLQTNRLMKRVKPDLCLMFGGYVSFPALIAARLRGIRSVLHEQNAFAGRVTSIAAKLGVPIASGWRDCEPLPHSSYKSVGTPIRRLVNIEKEDAWKTIGVGSVPQRGPTVSVMTGSLGSEKIVEILAKIFALADFSSWCFLVVDPDVDKPLKVCGNVTKLPQMWDIAPFYAVADLLLTRGGASTLAEVKALGKPAVIAPWRGAADDHQMKNARCISDLEKIRVWDEKNDSLYDLADKLQELYSNYVGKNGDSVNLLYNAGEASETNCRGLWDFVVDFLKEES